MKIQTETDTNCYLVPLNRTATVDPSKIKTLSDIKVKVSDFMIQIKCTSYCITLNLGDCM